MARWGGTREEALCAAARLHGARTMCSFGKMVLVLAWNRAYGPQQWIRHRTTCIKRNRTRLLSTMKQKKVLICT